MRIQVVLWYVLLLCCFPLYYWLNYETARHEFAQLLTLFSALFLIYFYLLSISDNYYGKNIGLTAGILFRILILFSLPTLTDDFYRYIWDGRMTMHGISPYSNIPANIKHHDLMLEDMYHLINSQEYFTVYPPTSQFFFWLANLTGDKTTTITISMKVLVLIMEVFSIFMINDLLKRFKLPTSYTLIYALNPLVIMEFTGSLHFEAAMICFLLLAVWLLQRKLFWLSAVAFTLAICAKLLPLLFLPFLFPVLGWKKASVYALVTIGCCLIFFLPFWETHLFWNILESLKLYFGSFEFNSSMYKLIEPYYTIRWIPAVAFIIYYSWFWKHYYQRLTLDLLMPTILIVMTAYFMSASTVHPWYIASLVVFACFSRFKYPLIWSALLPLTYVSYLNEDQYEQQLWVNVIEYSVVISFILFEIFILQKHVLDKPQKMVKA